ncbi:MAG TPA: PorV/PorQ family protein [bacterium]|nr:PorV/PorQ family protein [bacterium]
MNTISRWILIALLALSALAQAQNPNLGTSGAQFLKIPVSARAAAMGGAYVAVCQDATSPFWNPAGIAGIKGHAAHFSHTRWFDTFDVSAASYVYNAGSFGAFAASVMMLGVDEMEITTEFQPNGTGAFFDAQDMAVALSYGRELTDRFRVGLTARYIQQRIWNESAGGLAFDVGTQYQLPFRNLVIAMSMSNFGADMRYNGSDMSVKWDGDANFPNRLVPTRLETEAFALPLNFAFGIAMDLFRAPYARGLVALDAVHPNDNKECIHLGTEITFFDRLALRGGWKVNGEEELYDLGFGVNAFSLGIPLSFDYSYSAYDILPDVHRFSFGLSF